MVYIIAESVKTWSKVIIMYRSLMHGPASQFFKWEGLPARLSQLNVMLGSTLSRKKGTWECGVEAIHLINVIARNF